MFFKKKRKLGNKNVVVNGQARSSIESLKGNESVVSQSLPGFKVSGVKVGIRESENSKEQFYPLVAEIVFKMDELLPGQRIRLIENETGLTFATAQNVNGIITKEGNLELVIVALLDEGRRRLSAAAELAQVVTIKEQIIQRQNIQLQQDLSADEPGSEYPLAPGRFAPPQQTEDILAHTPKTSKVKHSTRKQQKADSLRQQETDATLVASALGNFEPAARTAHSLGTGGDNSIALPTTESVRVIGNEGTHQEPRRTPRPFPKNPPGEEGTEW